MRERGRLLLWGGLVSPLLMVLVGGALAWLRGSVWWLGPVAWGRVAWAPLVAVLSLGGTSLVAKVWPAFGQQLKQSGTSVSSEALAQVGYPVMLVVVAMAALGEELLFRGGVQPWVGPVAAALLFGLSHGGWRLKEMWAYVLAASFSGLLFGWLLLWAGTIWAPVLAHLCHNLAAVLFLGKRVDFSWERGWPWIRLVPEEVSPAVAAVEPTTLDEEPVSSTEEAEDVGEGAVSGCAEGGPSAVETEPLGEGSQPEVGISPPLATSEAGNERGS